MKSVLALCLTCLLLLFSTTACKTPSGEPEKQQAPDPTMTLNVHTPESFSVPAGQVMLFSFDHHMSVGNSGDYAISDPAIIAFEERLVEYENPESQAAGEPGGDGARGTFVFRAMTPGTTRLTVKTVSHAEPEWSRNFTVTVRETP